MFARTAIAGKFWPDSDEERALRSLNTEIWRLRTMLKGSGLEAERFLHSDHDCIGFRRDSDHWLDVAEFDALTQSLPTRNDRTTYSDFFPALQKAMVLYRGDLVEGLYDDWCLVPREAYRARLIATLEVLFAMAMEARHWHHAVAHGSRLLHLDPLQEHVHRGLMRCHFSLGNRPAALKQFATCERILRDELQIEPMDETLEFLKVLVASDGPSRSVDSQGARPAVSAGTYTAMQRIDVALSTLSTVQSWLEDANRGLRE